jgi:hypothetical protein
MVFCSSRIISCVALVSASLLRINDHPIIFTACALARITRTHPVYVIVFEATTLDAGPGIPGALEELWRDHVDPCIVRIRILLFSCGCLDITVKTSFFLFPDLMALNFTSVKLGETPNS